MTQDSLFERREESFLDLLPETSEYAREAEDTPTRRTPTPAEQTRPSSGCDCSWPLLGSHFDFMADFDAAATLPFFLGMGRWMSLLQSPPTPRGEEGWTVLSCLGAEMLPATLPWRRIWSRSAGDVIEMPRGLRGRRWDGADGVDGVAGDGHSRVVSVDG